MELKPIILTHPNIPKPLHGLNPRTLLGRSWWDKTRQKAYASTDYHCIACGVHKTEAKKHQWLEAHEFWDISYETGRCEVIEIVPLCHYCHNFIHSGRLAMIVNQEKSYEEVQEILKHGFAIIRNHNLTPFDTTVCLGRAMKVDVSGLKQSFLPMDHKIKWEDWVLVLEGKEYRSKFASYDEWLKFYK